MSMNFSHNTLCSFVTLWFKNFSEPGAKAMLPATKKRPGQLVADRALCLTCCFARWFNDGVKPSHLSLVGWSTPVWSARARR